MMLPIASWIAELGINVIPDPGVSVDDRGDHRDGS